MARFSQTVVSYARSRGGLWGIALASFAESTIVPIPFETMMVPMLLANRRRIWLIATISTVGCVAGALVGYAVGYFAFETVGLWVLDALDATSELREFQDGFARHGFWIVLAVGVSPIPFQVATVGGGLVEYSLLPFLAAATLSRSLRYYGLAFLVHLFGSRVERLVRRHGRRARLISYVLLVLVLAVILYSYLS